ncbi:TctA family transporter [Methanothermobacter sp. DSM 3267]
MVDYGRISVYVMIFMVGSILFFTLKEGASIPFIAATLIASTAFGLLPHSVGVSKSHLMGVLIIPAIIIYTGI